MMTLDEVFKAKSESEKIPFPETYYDKLNKLLNYVGLTGTKGNLLRTYKDKKTSIVIKTRFDADYRTVNKDSVMTVSITYPIYNQSGSSIGSECEELTFKNVVNNFETIMEKINLLISQIPTK